MFAIPYEGDFTLIGTTDLDFKGDLAAPTASAAEINYLCGAASAYFRKPVTPDQVLHPFSGVRQLYDDGARSAQNLTREYVLDLQGRAGEAPLLTVYGGKITTYRRLAEAALKRLAPYFKLGEPWTAAAPLPGAISRTTGSRHHPRARAVPFLTEGNARRWCGPMARASTILGDARDPERGDPSVESCRPPRCAT